MPKGTKSLATLTHELGMDEVTDNNFRKESQAYMKDNLPDVPNASDEAIEKLAVKWLNGGAGEKYFAFMAALNYQWEAGEHRLTIINLVGDIMKQQRWYMIDRLHKRVNGAVNCTGCLLHKPKARSATNGTKGTGHDGQADDSTDFSDAGSIHHSASKSNGVQGSQKRKRSHASLGGDEGAQYKRPRKSGGGEVNNAMLPGGKTGMPAQATTYHGMPPSHMSGFTPVNQAVAFGARRGSQPEAVGFGARRPSQPEVAAYAGRRLSQEEILASYGVRPLSQPATPMLTPTLAPLPRLTEMIHSMRYRGKTWHFTSIAHKATVLEKILLQEEKDVELYPILAFSKGAKRAALGGEDGSDGEESALKDYFRMFRLFMSDRFPGNEKILLENGVRPSV
ncbi:hypothetical protein H2200_012865 [Cladophialophora chaetospira]|uniref:Uncharacterized protein n=1 Tax=Cladophialophora chaetospira TaxID=386627 RepID=A0AA38WWY7_9EURO|nr:hypothetical protein H2200_012865 [Cladophialophora chaetospira]